MTGAGLLVSYIVTNWLKQDKKRLFRLQYNRDMCVVAIFYFLFYW